MRARNYVAIIGGSVVFLGVIAMIITIAINGGVHADSTTAYGSGLDSSPAAAPTVADVRTISSSVVGSLPCYRTADTWYGSLSYKQQFGTYPEDIGDQGAALMPGDRVQLLETHNVDEQPGLVSVTGAVQKVRIVDGLTPGETCWLYTGSNPNGPLFE